MPTADFGQTAKEMNKFISKRIEDKALKDWMMPNFTTTRHTDRSVAAILMIAATQNYFNFVLSGGWGYDKDLETMTGQKKKHRFPSGVTGGEGVVPSVRLLGKRSDWEEILNRVKELPKYGAEAEQ